MIPGVTEGGRSPERSGLDQEGVADAPGDHPGDMVLGATEDSLTGSALGATQGDLLKLYKTQPAIKDGASN